MANRIRLFSERLKVLMSVLYVNYYSIIALFFIYIFYWNFTQFQDLLMTLVQEQAIQVILFFVTSVILATICWYFPKFLYPENADKFRAVKSVKETIKVDLSNHQADDHNHENVGIDKGHYNQMIPRLLSTGVLMVIALGILNVGNIVAPDQFKASAGLFFSIIVIFTILSTLIGHSENSPIAFHKKIVAFTARRKVYLWSPFVLGGVFLMYHHTENDGVC